MRRKRGRSRTTRPQGEGQLFDWLALALATLTILAIVSDARVATITP